MHELISMLPSCQEEGNLKQYGDNILETLDGKAR